MKTPMRLLMGGAAASALAAWFLVSSGMAADDDDVRGGVEKIAGAIEKGGAGSGKAQAAAIAKNAEMDEVMALMKLRAKKGLGIGEKGTVPANQDGIEAKIMALGKKPLSKSEVAAQAKALEKAAYRAAAISEIAQAHKPDKNVKDWEGWAKDMEDDSLKLAEAAKEKDPKAIKAAATKLEGTCNACHEKFR